MGIAKHNKKTLSQEWGIDTTNFEYKKSAELEMEKVYTMRGLFISKDNGYGEGLVIILDDCFVNASQSYIEEAKDILADEEAVEQIKNGKAGVKFHKFYAKKYKKDGYGLQFIELD